MMYKIFLKKESVMEGYNTTLMKKILLLNILLFFVLATYSQKIEKGQNFGILPDSCELLTLFEGTEALMNSELFLNQNGYPYISLGGKVVGILPDTTFRFFELPDKSSPSQIICTENGIIYLKNKNLIQTMEDDDIRTLFTMKDTKFQLNAISDYLLYITTYTKDSSTVFVFDADASQIMKLFVMAGKINDIVGNGYNTYIAIGHTLFLLSDNTMFKIMDIEQEITTLAWTEYGLFFSTTKNIGYMVNPHQPLPFIAKPAKKLLTWDNQMYIQFEDGTISILFGLEYFENFVNSVYNY